MIEENKVNVNIAKIGSTTKRPTQIIINIEQSENKLTKDPTTFNTIVLTPVVTANKVSCDDFD